MAFSIFWDDENVRSVVLIGATADSGGGSQGFLPNNLGYDESAPPSTANVDDEEFDSPTLDDRWKFFGTMVEGNVARGASFTAPLGTARYSLSNRRGWLQIQPVADALATAGQGVYAELSAANKNAGNAPTNWLLKVGGFLEVDMSTLPVGNLDSSVLVGLWDKAMDGTADMTRFVGVFIGTNFLTPDTPLVIGAVKIVPPDDLADFGTPLRMAALPANSKIKIHKIGTTYRVYAVIDGRHVELGSASIPSLNPVIFGWQQVNADTPNAIGMLDHFRHEFTDTDAE